MELTKELITWILIAVGTNLSAVVLAIIAWIKAAKMMPKEIKGAELNNKGKEVSIADQFDALATKAAERAVSLQARLTAIEIEYDTLKASHDNLFDKVALQEAIIQEQARTIEFNNIRLNEQETKICEQDEVINELKFDLGVSQQYNSELIAQMRAKNLIPVEAPKRKYTKQHTVDN